ncbi:MAG TPA: PAS domain S-box protein [Leptolyngbyaceae cyanobacterium]
MEHSISQFTKYSNSNTFPSWPNLLQGVAEATKQLLTISDYQTAINQALGTLGQVTGVDRVYIFQIHPHSDTGEPAMSQRFEWANSTVNPEIDNPILQNLPFSKFGMSRWYEVLRSGNLIKGLTQELSAEEKLLIEPQGILSIFIVPIPVNGQLWGFIGFDDCHTYRQWSKDEEAVLMTTAATLGGVIFQRQVEEELRQERDFIAAVLDTAGALVLVLDRQGRIIRFNCACEQTTNYSFTEVQGKCFWDLFIIPEEIETVKAVFHQLQAGHFPINNQNYWVTKNGNRRLINWSNTAILDRDRNVKYIIATGIDITEHYLAEEELRKSEELYRTLARNFPNGVVFLFDRDLRYTIAEGAGISEVDLSKELIEGKTIWEVWPPEICEIVEPHYRAALAGKATNFELEYQEKFYLLHTLPVKNESGEIFAGMLMSQDITEQKRVEIALRESEKRLRKQNNVLMELAKRKTINSGDFNAAIQEITEAAARTLEIERTSVWFYNQDRSKIFCVDLYERSAHQHSQGLELAAVNYPDYFKALETERTIAAADAYKDPRTREFSANYLRPIGVKSMLDAPIWLGGQMVGTVCHEEVEPGRQWSLEEENFAGSIADLISLAIEAFERKKAEQQLQEREEQYRHIFEATKDGLIITDLDGLVIEANPAACRIHGYAYEEFIGLHPQNFIHPDYHYLIPQFMETIKNGMQCEGEGCGIRKDRTPFSVEFHGKKFTYKGKPHILTVLRDITERKSAEAALRESEEKFSKAFRACPDPITISTLNEGRFIDVNESFLDLTGYQREEVIGRTAFELNIWVNPEDRNNLKDILKKEGVVRNQELEFRGKSGQVYLFLFSAEIITLGGELCILVVNHDITKRKQAEQQLLAAAERDRILAQIALRIRRSLNLEEILNTTVTEIREFLKADRVLISHLDGNHYGQVFAESISPGWEPLLGLFMEEESYMKELRDFFSEAAIQAINDVNKVTISNNHREHIHRYQVKACLAVPIMLGDEFFGTLVAHQCSDIRHWQQFEIDLLEQLATQVAIAIQQAKLYQQVQELNTNLEKQVEERTSQLQQRNQELQELNQLKDVFLHAVTHDLRTPVMGWLLVLKNLLNTHSSDSIIKAENTIPVSRTILERMVQSNDRQLQLINSLLEVHSSEVRGLSLDLQPVQINQLFAAIIQDLEPLLVKNQATVHNQLPSELPVINADPAQLWRVVENLFTNALNHNPPGLILTLNATVQKCSLQSKKSRNSPTCTPKFMRVSLQDNGIGMDRETREHLFELYVRGSHVRRATGIGLGLYLCRQIINAHGGEIGAISSPGNGTTFWFTLPI